MIYSTNAVDNIGPKKTEKLIQLRAQGLSAGKIAKELHINKATVCDAIKIFEKEIQNEEFAEVEEIKEKYKMARKYRLERFMKQLKKVYDEIEKRSLEEMKMKDLLAYANELEGKISEETSKIQYDGGLIEDILEDSNDLEFYERKAYLEME